MHKTLIWCRAGTCDHTVWVGLLAAQCQRPVRVSLPSLSSRPVTAAKAGAGQTRAAAGARPCFPQLARVGARVAFNDGMAWVALDYEFNRR
jgi:hypothetical protein